MFVYRAVLNLNVSGNEELVANVVEYDELDEGFETVASSVVVLGGDCNVELIFAILLDAQFVTFVDFVREV